MNDNDEPWPDGADRERALKVILSVSENAADRVEPLVAKWQRDRIAWIAVVGPDCAAVEGRIKALLSSDAVNRARFVMVTAHPGETLEEVTDFMLALVGEYEGDVAIVEV